MKGLELRNITSGYYISQPVIHGISLSVKPKNTMVLMGQSGSGKSTLLLTILGILKPAKGSIIINGTDVTSTPIENRNIGYLPQNYDVFPHLNVFDNIVYGLKIRGMPESKQHVIAKEMIALTNLNGLETKKVKELSGGQQQRVGLARALAIKPNLLLLDEPLSNIDQITKYEVAKDLKQLFEKLDIPIILVTHNYEDTLFLAESLAIMIDGKIAQTGTLNDVIKKPKLDIINRLLKPFNQQD